MRRISIAAVLLVALFAGAPSAKAECETHWGLADVPPGPRVFVQEEACAAPDADRPTAGGRTNATYSDGLTGTHVEAELFANATSVPGPASRELDTAAVASWDVEVEGFVPAASEGVAHAVVTRTPEGCAYDLHLSERTSGPVGSSGGLGEAEPCPVRNEGWDPIPL